MSGKTGGEMDEEVWIVKARLKIKELEVEVEMWRDRAEGLECDLDSAIQVMRRRVRGEKDIKSMGRWLDLNYPCGHRLRKKWRKALTAKETRP